MLKMIAFDFDGTLAPTIPMVIDVFRRSVAPYVEHELTKQAIVQTFGLNEVGMVNGGRSLWPPFIKNTLAHIYECQHRIRESSHF